MLSVSFWPPSRKEEMQVHAKDAKVRHAKDAKKIQVALRGIAAALIAEERAKASASALASLGVAAND